MLAVIKTGFGWVVIGAFVEPDEPFEKWRLSVFALDNMKEIKTQYEAQIASAKAFSLEKYIDSFVYDPSDTFDDDRILLEHFLINYRARKKYGRPIRSVKSM